MDKVQDAWKLVKIGSLLEKKGTINPKLTPSKEFTYIDITSIDKNQYKIVNPKKILGKEAPSRARKIVKKNDVIFATTRPNLKNIAIISKEYSNPVASTGFCVLSPKTNLVDSKFLFNFLLTEGIQEQISPFIRGAQYPAISDNNLQNCLIPLPPLPEQKRIVSKLDALFERIDQSIALLEENIKHTEALMASALDEVFSNIKAKKDFLETCCEKIQYGYTGKTLENGKYYYLRITDIQDGIVDFSKTPFSDISEKDVNKYRLSKGDILFARTGATAGKSYLFESNNSSVFASYLIRVVCNRDVLKPGFLYWYFQSGDYWKQIFAGVTGAAQPNFNGKKLGNLIIPIPEKIIQEKVISKAKTVHAAMVKVQTERKEKLNHLKSLKNSILDKAFKGEL